MPRTSPHPPRFLRGGGVLPLLPKNLTFPKHHNFSESSRLSPKNSPTPQAGSRDGWPRMAQDARDEAANRPLEGENRRDKAGNRRDDTESTQPPDRERSLSPCNLPISVSIGRGG